jgi:hypothetical protein
MQLGMPRIVSKQNLDVDEEVCACVIHWKEAFFL